MQKYAKIMNEITKEVIVGHGTNTQFYIDMGMSLMDVEQAYTGFWYVTGYAPVKPAPTREEVEQLRIQYRKDNIDNKTIERNRRLANGSWAEEDEQAYLALDAQVTAYINEHFPYPVGNQ